MSTRTAFYLVSFLSAITLLCSCEPRNAPNKILHDKILGELNTQFNNLKLKKSAYAIVDMDSLSGVKWDRIYFFRGNSGYPTDENMSSVIGAELKSGSIPDNATRLIFTSAGSISAVVDFNQDENIWLYGGDPLTEGYNLYGKFNRGRENKFVFYPNCNYNKHYYLKPASEFNPKKDFIGESYTQCY